MSAFDKVIGYESIKTELSQVCDVIHNPEIYREMGAHIPRGILLSGNPGLGKTLLADAFIEESGLPAYLVRRDANDIDFIADIAAEFKAAKDHAPAIVFLDDMDKFANEDDRHRDAEEYVAVQAAIDSVKDSEVYVIATVNDENKLPQSLIRAGRFDRRIEVETPCEDDAEKIIRHFLSNKNLADDISIKDISKMISYSSCAELETIINEAAIYAAFGRKPAIEMSDVVKAVLRMEYSAPDDLNSVSLDDITNRAVHEAGHLVVSEILCPGSVGLASIRTQKGGSSGGFIHMCKDLPRRPHVIMVSLAGKAALEMESAETVASGCQSDINRAICAIRDGINKNGTCGMALLDVSGRYDPSSDMYLSSSEAVVHAELERYMLQVKDILYKNRGFFGDVVAALMEKETLLYSDIKALRENAEVSVAEV